MVLSRAVAANTALDDLIGYSQSQERGEVTVMGQGWPLIAERRKRPSLPPRRLLWFQLDLEGHISIINEARQR